MDQVFRPWIQRRRLAYAKHKHVISGILRHAQMQALGRLIDDGKPNVDVMKKLVFILHLVYCKVLAGFNYFPDLICWLVTGCSIS